MRYAFTVSAVAAVFLALSFLVAVTAGLQLPAGGPRRFTPHPLADAAIFALTGAALAIPVPLLLAGLALSLLSGTLLLRLSATPLRTKPPGKTVVLYDGHCRFCSAQMKNLVRLARPGAIEPASFQEPGALDPYPGITYAACMEAMQLVTSDGRIYSAFEAAVRAVATRPLGKIAYAYYLPGLRILFDTAYAILAANRYRLTARAIATADCTDACAVHFKH